MVFSINWASALPTAPDVPAGNPRGLDSLWVGALTPTGATVVVRLSGAGDARVACTSVGGTVRSSTVAIASGGAKIPITGLTADTEYSYQVEVNAASVGSPGRFKTAPAAGAASFTIGFSGDANTASNHAVFDRIRTVQPLLFIHMGDLHYTNITANNQALYHAAYDTVLSQPRQAALYRDIPTVYVFDDHDYANDNSNASATSHDAACAVYRARVPHYPLGDATVTAPVYQAFTIGRVRFLVTEQRSAASADSATDNASKTVLGSSQKAWFKSEISTAAAAGQMIVWVCPRVWGGTPTAGADGLQGFSTERAELVDYIHANASGRVVVLSADMHAMGIDDGSHHDFATSGSEPLKTFQCAPLDRTPALPGPSTGLVYSEGITGTQGVYGTMAITDAGGGTIGVTWKGFNSSGTELTTYSFNVAV